MLSLRRFTTYGVVLAGLLSAAVEPVVAQSTGNAQATVITFEDAIRLALKQSAAVRQAQNTVASSEATVRQRSGALLPNLSVSTNTSESFGFTFNQNEGKIVDSKVTSLNLNASSQLTLYDGGRNLSQLRESRLTTDANDSDLQRARQTAMFTAASGFLTLVQRQEQVRVQEDNLKVQMAQDTVIQRMVRAGARPISDQYQQQATLASAQYNLITAQRDLELARVAMIRTLQLNPSGTYEFTAPVIPDSIHVVQFDLDSLLTKAIGSRADLEALDTRVEATGFSLKTAGGSRLPQLNMSMGYGTAFNSASTLPMGDQFNQRRNGSLGLSVSIPVFDRRSASVAIEQAKIAADNAQINLADRKLAVAAEVREAFLNHRAAIGQLAAARAQLAAAELAASTQARRYEVGAGSLVEVTTARAQLVQAASAVVTAKYALAFQQSLMSYYVGDLSPESAALRALVTGSSF